MGVLSNSSANSFSEGLKFDSVGGSRREAQKSMGSEGSARRLARGCRRKMREEELREEVMSQPTQKG